jgi:hypothetical protein
MTFRRPRTASAGTARRRAALALVATVLCAPAALRAAEGSFGVQAGAALPQGSAKNWTGSGPGFAVDLTETFSLDLNQSLRMRLGYLSYQGIGPRTESLAVPGAAYADFPVASNNQLYQFSYGLDYLRSWSPGFYLGAGTGLAYLTASRSGTVNLASAGAQTVNYRYDSNKLTPYLSVSAGYAFTSSIALEARYQLATLGGQVRQVDLSQAGYSSPAQVAVPSITASTLVLGLVVTF